MDRNAIFEKVALHLLRQGAKAQVTEGGFCAYRGLGGRSCAIGCLIPDEKYTKAIEGISFDQDCEVLLESYENLKVTGEFSTGSVDHLLAILDDLVGLERYDDVEFLAALQGVHDHQEPALWPIALAQVAQDYQVILTNEELAEFLDNPTKGFK